MDEHLERLFGFVDEQKAQTEAFEAEMWSWRRQKEVVVREL